MATAKTATQLEQLAAEFPTSAHKSRRQGGRDLTYLSIDATINRVNEVLGAKWSVVPPSRTTCTAEVRTSKDDEGDVITKTVYVAFTELFVEAEIDGHTKTLYGVGGDAKPDPDDAVKTALAEAIKKAFHQAGVGLYLWDEEARERIASKRKLENASFSTLKKAVFDLAKEKLDKPKPSAKEIAELFGVKPGELVDEATLREILKKEGLL